jgi:hypothetical protein
MSWLIAALITFGSLALLVTHLSPQTMRRAMGYAMWWDIILHGSILWMFLGTSTLGLLQAEAAGILFSISFRVYRKLLGYEKLHGFRWVRYKGVLA